MPLDSVGRHGDSPPEAGFSQSRRASPAVHQSTPNLPVSRCRFPLAFCRTVTARRKPAHSLFRLYSVEKIFSTTPLLPSRTPHVLGLRNALKSSGGMPHRRLCSATNKRFPARGWLLPEQTCIARGARVGVGLTCLCRGTPQTTVL